MDDLIPEAPFRRGATKDVRCQASKPRLGVGIVGWRSGMVKRNHASLWSWNPWFEPRSRSTPNIKSRFESEPDA